MKSFLIVNMTLLLNSINYQLYSHRFESTQIIHLIKHYHLISKKKKYNFSKKI